MQQARLSSKEMDWFSPTAVYQIGLDPIRNDKILQKLDEARAKGDFVLAGFFRYCQLLDRYRRQPDIALQEQLLQLYRDSFEIPDTYEKPLWERDLTFPMNKIAGVFKKEYERKCKINDKGFVQLDEKLNPKAFAVKKVMQLEQYQQNKERKLEWIKELAEYPFRVLLTDGNDSLRGIYCKTKQQAEEIKDFAFCITKKLKNVAVVNLINRVRTKKFEQAMAEEFYKQMDSAVVRQQTIRQKSVMGSRKPSQASVMMNQPPIEPVIPRTLSASQSGAQIGSMAASLLNPNISPDLDRQERLNQSRSNIAEPFNKEGKKRAVSKLIDFDRTFLGGFVNDWSRAADRLRRSGSQSPSRITPFTVTPMPVPAASLSPFPQFPVNTEPEQKGKTVQPLLQSNRSDRYQTLSVEQFTLKFRRLQLLLSSDVYIKPQLTIAISRGEKLLYTSKFETVLQKRLPRLTYNLVADRQENQAIDLRENINLLSLDVTLKDRIAGIDIYNGQLPMRLKERFSQIFFVASQNGQLRLELEYLSKEESTKPEAANQVISQEGLVLNIIPMSRNQEDAIKRYWKELASRKDYYSHDLELDIVEILNKIETVPKYWWMGLTEDDYQMLSLLEAATKVLGFIVVEAHLYIVRALLKIHESSDRPIERACKQALSLITNYLHPYFVKDQLNKIHPLHQFLNLDSDCSFQSRLALELAVLGRMLEGEYPDLLKKLEKKNIHLQLLLMEYVFEVFSRNFNIRVLVGLWNDIFKDVRYVQPKLLCLCVAIVGKYKLQLLQVNVESQLRTIFEDTAGCPTEEPLIEQISNLGTKYFTKPQGLLNSIAARLFSESYFQPTLNKFYKQQTTKLQDLTERRQADKLELIEKISQRVKFTIPNYPPRPYVLHLYFSRFPALEGIVFIKAGVDEYECFKKDAQQYFIIENVVDVVEVSYVYRGKRWAAVLPTVQGVHFGRVRLQASSDADNEQPIEMDYVCALLTDAQEKVIKKGRPSQHFISPYMKLSDLVLECYKPLTECLFFQQNDVLPYQLLQAARVLFSAGGNRFNELDFYLTWIQSLKLPIFDKIEQLKAYSEAVSMQQYHCHLPAVFKLLLRQLLSRMSFPISDEEFEFYYNGKVPQFHAPRIVKCRYTHKDGRRAKLTNEAQRYVSLKASRQLFSDLVLTCKYFLAALAKPISDQLGVEVDGLLTIIYSSDGEIRRSDFPILVNRDTKEVHINNKVNFIKQFGVTIKQLEPEVLSSEGFPSFNRLTRMFESPMTVGGLNSPPKHLQKPVNKEYFNILLDVEDKLTVVLPLRYKKYPTQFKVPLLSYVCELTQSIMYAPLPRILFQGEEWNPKRICTYLGELEISDNQQGQNFPVDKRIGLQANIAKWNLRTPVVYFWKTSEQKIVRTTRRVFLNYGMSVFRWERCQVRGYCTGEKSGNRYYIINLHGEGTQIFYVDRLVMADDLELGNDNPFAEVDISKEEALQLQLKRLEGKSDSEKNISLADRRKFLNYLQMSE